MTCTLVTWEAWQRTLAFWHNTLLLSSFSNFCSFMFVASVKALAFTSLSIQIFLTRSHKVESVFYPCITREVPLIMVFSLRGSHSYVYQMTKRLYLTLSLFYYFLIVNWHKWNCWFCKLHGNFSICIPSFFPGKSTIFVLVRMWNFVYSCLGIQHASREKRCGHCLSYGHYGRC